MTSNHAVCTIKFLWAAVVACCWLTTPALGGGVSFRPLGNLDGGFSAFTAFDVSGDGSVVVGQGFDAMGIERGFRWSTDGSIVVFDNFEARGVSGDGQVVVGRASLGVGADGAARWTSAGGVTSICSLPGDLDIG